jgi:AraC-like DNA-binding protein
MGYGEEFSCLLALANLCQVLAGMAQDWLVPPDDGAIIAGFLLLPPCKAAIEELAAQCVLRDFLLKLQRVIHANFHKRCGGACGEGWRMPQWHAGMSIAQVVRAWALEFQGEFRRQHDAVDIVKALIVSQLASPPTTTALARAVGMSRRALERGFLKRTHETIVAFRTRERVALLDRLVTEGMKFSAAARAAGWKSTKDAYRAYKRLFERLPRERRTAA